MRFQKNVELLTLMDKLTSSTDSTNFLSWFKIKVKIYDSELEIFEKKTYNSKEFIGWSIPFI